jgi:hypothetical protein
LDYGQPVVFLIGNMPLHKQGFDVSPSLTGLQFSIAKPFGNVGRGIQIGVEAVIADHTTERLLIWSIGSICVVTHTAFLRGIGGLDPGGLYPPFGGSPGQLLRDMG